jgi:hypothetical protein
LILTLQLNQAQASEGVARIADDLLYQLGMPWPYRREVECQNIGKKAPHLLRRLLDLFSLKRTRLQETMGLGVP